MEITIIEFNMYGIIKIYPIWVIKHMCNKGGIVMNKVTVQINGMMCGNCENHMNEAIKKEFNPSKVKSSHKKGETVFVVDGLVEETKLKEVVEDAGYDMVGFKVEPYKKSLFGF